MDDSGLSQYDENGKLLSWDERRKNAKASMEIKREKIAKKFEDKEKLLNIRKQKQKNEIKNQEYRRKTEEYNSKVDSYLDDLMKGE